MSEPLKAFIPLKEAKQAAQDVASVVRNMKSELRALEKECATTAAKGGEISKELRKRIADVKDQLRAHQRMAREYKMAVNPEKSLGFRQIRRETKDWRGAADLLMGRGNLRDVKDFGEVGGSIAGMFKEWGGSLRESDNKTKKRLGRILTRMGLRLDRGSELVLGSLGYLYGTKFAWDSGYEAGTWLEQRNPFGAEGAAREATKKQTELLASRAGLGGQLAQNRGIGGREAAARYNAIVNAQTIAAQKEAFHALTPADKGLVERETARRIELEGRGNSRLALRYIYDALNVANKYSAPLNPLGAGVTWLTGKSPTQWAGEFAGIEEMPEARRKEIREQVVEAQAKRVKTEAELNVRAMHADAALNKALEFDWHLQRRAIETQALRSRSTWSPN